MFELLKALDSMSGGHIVRRFDDVNLSAFVQNQLLDVIPQLYDRKFQALDAAEHIPVGPNGVNPGAMAWAYDSFDQRGVADFIGANARDMPRADISNVRTSFPIRTIVSSYGWTLEEIEAARFASVPLDVRKGVAARRAIAELEHNTLLFGNAARGLPWFLRNPSTPLMTVPNGDWLNPATTADQMLDDLNAMVDAVFVGTKKVHRVNRIALPNTHFRRAQTSRLSNTTDTVMAFFERTNPGVTIRALTELSTEGPSSAPRAIAYELSADNLGGVVPLGFQQLDPQIWGFETVIPARERMAGTVWYYPASAVLADGI